MNIVEINSCNFGSTGNIMLGITQRAEQRGHSVLVAYPKSKDNLRKGVRNSYLIGSRFSRNLHLLLSKLTGYSGVFSFFSTKRFLKWLSAFSPDCIHLHNLHNGYINLPLLFRYIKKRNIPVVWTLHDCWAFTGHCPHFTLERCERWKTGCCGCNLYREYPETYLDRSKRMWKLKKKWFSGVKNLTVVTPSAWLGDLAKQSFLGEYPVKVIHNGLDLQRFAHRDSDFRKAQGLENKYIVLGVAFCWEKRKGFDVFVSLAERLGNRYQVVLVGHTDEDNKNILSLGRVETAEKLAELYQSADVFANPTREDNFPTVNLEALACGTPVITFETGGSPESIDDTCGCVVPCDDVAEMERQIRRVCEERPYSVQACRFRAEQFSAFDRFNDYVNLFEEMRPHEA